MIVTASVTGLIKTLLIILGGFVVLRFFGQLMNAKRNLAEDQRLKKESSKRQGEKSRKKKELGKVTINSTEKQSDIEDVEYEEM